MPKFAIGPFTFATKAEATEAVRAVLHGTPIGSHLSGSDYTLIRSLIDMHPNREQKVGSGIESISVRVIEFGNPGFWIHRTDGTSTDFSYRKAITRPSHRAEVTATLRRLIMPQIDAYHRSLFGGNRPVVCPITGETLTADHGHVDHVVPFTELVAEFMSKAGLTFDDIELASGVDGQIGRSIANDGLAELWEAYHLVYAQLRYIHPAANSARGRAA